MGVGGVRKWSAGEEGEVGWVCCLQDGGGGFAELSLLLGGHVTCTEQEDANSRFEFFLLTRDRKARRRHAGGGPV
jgi:hypothetical protein